MLYVYKIGKIVVAFFALIILTFLSVMDIIFKLIMGPAEDTFYHALSDIIVNLFGIIGMHIASPYNLFCSIDNCLTVLLPLEIICLIIGFLIACKLMFKHGFHNNR